MRHPEIGQRVVIHRHPAAQPAIGQMLLAQLGQLSRTPEPVEGRPRPLSPTTTAPSSARGRAGPAPAPPRAPSPLRAVRANRAQWQTPTPLAPDGRGQSGRRAPPPASRADAALADAGAAPELVEGPRATAAGAGCSGSPWNRSSACDIPTPIIGACGNESQSPVVGKPSDTPYPLARGETFTGSQHEDVFDGIKKSPHPEVPREARPRRT